MLAIAVYRCYARAAANLSTEWGRAMDEVLTVDEVARYLRVHEVTVQRWCRTGELPAAKIGRAYRIKKGDLDAWWDARTHRGGSPQSDSGHGTGEPGGMLVD